MTVVALASAKGSPGVTTATVAVAAQWPPPRQAVLVELDPAGGDIGAWFGLQTEPGTGSLAAAARRGVAAGSLLDHCQRLPDGVRVVLGQPAAERAHRAATLLAPDLARAGGDGIDVVADCGRLDPASPAVEVARQADFAVLVSRLDVAALGHLAALVARLSPACRSVALVLVGRGPYPPAEVSAAVGAAVLGVLPHDPEGAALVAAGRHGSRGRRSPLLRSAGDLAAAIAGYQPAGVSGNGPGPGVRR